MTTLTSTTLRSVRLFQGWLRALVTRVLHEEFLAWFGAETAGEVLSYRALASDVWQVKRSREA
jgi:hypothetical protein